VRAGGDTEREGLKQQASELGGGGPTGGDEARLGLERQHRRARLYLHRHDRPPHAKRFHHVSRSRRIAMSGMGIPGHCRSAIGPIAGRPLVAPAEQQQDHGAEQGNKPNDRMDEEGGEGGVRREPDLERCG
jgi:hypothetical protein